MYFKTHKRGNRICSFDHNKQKSINSDDDFPIICRAMQLSGYELQLISYQAQHSKMVKPVK